MKVKFTKNTVAAKQFVKIGDVCDLPKDEAKFLINIGKAVAFIDPEAPEVPELITQPAPKRRKGKAKNDQPEPSR